MIRKLLTVSIVTVSLAVVACGGGGVDQDEAQQIQDHATRVRQDAQKAADEVRAGTKDAEQAAKEVQEDATDLANESIDAVEDADIPDEAREQLEAAQKQRGVWRRAAIPQGITDSP